MVHDANDGGSWINKHTPEQKTLNGLGAAALGAIAILPMFLEVALVRKHGATTCLRLHRLCPQWP